MRLPPVMAALIKRSDFGASSVIFSLFAGDDVELIIETEFEKEQG